MTTAIVFSLSILADLCVQRIVREGIEQAARGELRDLGSFVRFANEGAADD